MTVYDALVAAADFFALRNENGRASTTPTPRSMYRAYESEALSVRPACTATSARPRTWPKSSGWDILKPLRADLEACYANWFVPKLALAWGKFVDPQGTGLLAKWGIERVPNQYGSSTDTSSPASRRPTTARRSSSSAMPSVIEAAQELLRSSTAGTASRRR